MVEVRALVLARSSGRALLALALIALAAVPASARQPVRVRYRSAETVYLDAGTIDGLSPGQRLEVERDGSVIAEVEVFFAAENSASCRFLVEHRKVESDDLIRWQRPGVDEEMPPPAPEKAPIENAIPLGAATVPRVPTPLPEAASALRERFLVRARTRDAVYLQRGPVDLGDSLEVMRSGEQIAMLVVEAISGATVRTKILSESRTVRVGDVAELVERALPADNRWNASGAGALPTELALEADPVTPTYWEPQMRGTSMSPNRVTGTFSVNWESSTETSGPVESAYERSNGRLDLHVSDIKGRPYEVRVRMRAQRNQRSFSDGEEESDNRDRLYELSLTYDPRQGRYAYRIGRMSASPFVGIGYFDGVLGQFAVSSFFEVGGFAGRSAQLEATGLGESRPKYGIFTRFTSPTTDSGFPWEVVVAGVREHGEEEISREYVTLQSRYSAGGRWSFFQRAEVDVNRGWRKELTGQSSQLSNLSLSATARLSRYGRFSVAYDRFEQYRTEETRELPEDLFRDLQRQGLRANLQFGNPRKFNFALTASLRDQEGEEAETTAYGFWLRHGSLTPWDLAVTLNYVGFSNAFTSGYIATLRSSKRLRSGHQFDLVLGTRLSGSEVFTEEAERTTEWLRMRAWFELPRSLFATAEYEWIFGDDLDGQRLSWGFGYRF